MANQIQCIEDPLDIDYFKTQTAHLTQKKGYRELLKLLTEHYTITDSDVLKYNINCLLSELNDFITKNALKDLNVFNKIRDQLSEKKLRLTHKNPLNVDYFKSQTTHLKDKKDYPQLLQRLTNYNMPSDIDTQRSNIEHLLAELNHFIHKRTTKDIEYLKVIRNHLKHIEIKLAHENPLNAGFFANQTAHLAKQTGYAELLKLIIEHNAETDINALKSNVHHLTNTLDSFMQASAGQDLEYLKTASKQLGNIKTRLKHQDTSIAEVPNKIHFIHIGSAVNVIQGQQLALWQKLYQPQGYLLSLWYDSDALLTETMNQIINDAVAEKIFKANPSIIQSTFLSSMRETVHELKKKAYDTIQLAIASGVSADEARIDLLEQRYGQSRETLLKIKQVNQDSLCKIADLGIKLQDLRTTTLDEWLLKPHYERELNWRSDINAATHMACLQILALQGGIYSAIHLLPPLSERFWRDITLLSLKNQGKSITNKPQLEKTTTQLKKEWQTTQSAQLYTWQLLWQNNPDWMPGHTVAAQALQTYKENMSPTLVTAIEHYTATKHNLSEVFSPLNPIIISQNTLRMATSFFSTYSTELLAAHPNSAMVQAVIRQITSNYHLLKQIDQEFSQKNLNRQERALVSDRLMNDYPPLGHDVIQAVVDYYNQGLLVGSDATTILSGAGSLKQGIAAYAKEASFPPSIIAPALLSLPAEQTNTVTLMGAKSGVPLNSHQQANVLYQHYKIKVTSGRNHYPILTSNLLTLDKNQAQKDNLPPLALTSEVPSFLPTQLFEILEKAITDNALGMLAIVTQIKTAGKIAKLIYQHTTHAYHIVENEIIPYTKISTLQRLESGIRAFIGLPQCKEIIESSQHRQLQHIKEISLKSFRKMLKGDLKDHFDTLVYSNLSLSEPDSVTGNKHLIYLPDEIDASNGINNYSVKSGNYCIYKPDPKKGVLFSLRHGHDTIIGVKNKPNQFLLTTGQKVITGGQCNDIFIIHTTPEQTHQQISWTKNHNTSSYQLTGGNGHNTLIIKANLITTPEISSTEQTSANNVNSPCYLGYDIDLQQGTVRVREDNTGHSEQYKTDPAPLMTVRNIKQIEVTTSHPTKNSIRGSDEDNTFIMNDGDTIYTQDGNNVIVIQGGGEVYGGPGCNTYFINDNINKKSEPNIIIHRENSNKTSTIYLPIACHQLTPWRLIENHLVVELGYEANSYKLILADVYETEGKQHTLSNPNFLFFTHDGWMLQHQLEQHLNSGQKPSVTFAAVYSKVWDQRPSASPTPPLSEQYSIQAIDTVLAPVEALHDQITPHASLAEDISSLNGDGGDGTAYSNASKHSFDDSASLTVPLSLRQQC